MDLNQRSHLAVDLQSTAITTMRPTHINGFPGIFVKAHNRKELLTFIVPLVIPRRFELLPPALVLNIRFELISFPNKTKIKKYFT